MAIASPMVTALTSGAGSDLLGQLSTTKAAGGGVYSPYVGAVVDVAACLESFHNPIPDTSRRCRTLKAELTLSSTISIVSKAMSVLVVGLPPANRRKRRRSAAQR